MSCSSSPRCAAPVKPAPLADPAPLAPRDLAYLSVAASIEALASDYGRRVQLLRAQPAEVLQVLQASAAVPGWLAPVAMSRRHFANALKGARRLVAEHQAGNVLAMLRLLGIGTTARDLGVDRLNRLVRLWDAGVRFAEQTLAARDAAAVAAAAGGDAR